MKYLLFLLLPKAALSRFLGRIERLERPKWLIHRAKKAFIRFYKLNMDEAERSMEEYKSLNDLFTRKLKGDARPILGEVIHPCDAVISQTGSIQDGEIVQAKGWTYSVKELIGHPPSSEDLNGTFATYYLCPTDYHRVHFPVSGKLTGARHLVGKLWPVNEWSVNTVKNLFCVNERLVFDIQTDFGFVYMVMVGATNVGHITSSFIPELKTNLSFWRRSKDFDFSKNPKPVRVGEEAGIFHMGSTVIMIYPEGYKNLNLSPGPTRLGEKI